MNDLQIFTNPDFGEVRTIEENGAVMFCGSDVAKALGYSNPRDAISRHCRGVVKRDTPTESGMQEMSFIPESDLYRLVFGSKLPTAERFTDWVTEEILPAIRRHGSYSRKPLTPRRAAFGAGERPRRAGTPTFGSGGDRGKNLPRH